MIKSWAWTPLIILVSLGLLTLNDVFVDIRMHHLLFFTINIILSIILLGLATIWAIGLFIISQTDEDDLK